MLPSDATGIFVSRVSCSYANSAQPDSTASDSVSLTSAVTPTPTPAAPSGGGGGGAASITGKVIEEISGLTVDIEILDEYLEVLAGGKVLAKLIIDYDPSSENAENVSLDYFIENSEGSVLVSASELINVKGETSILRELEMPFGVQVDKYWFVANGNLFGACSCVAWFI